MLLRAVTNGHSDVCALLLDRGVVVASGSGSVRPRAGWRPHRLSWAALTTSLFDGILCTVIFVLGLAFADLHVIATITVLLFCSQTATSQGRFGWPRKCLCGAAGPWRLAGGSLRLGTIHGWCLRVKHSDPFDLCTFIKFLRHMPFFAQLCDINLFSSQPVQ